MSRGINLGHPILDKKVGMTVVPQITKFGKHARRGQTKLSEGSILYCIAYDNGGFFTFSYVDKEDAERAIRNMKFEGTDTERYRQFNYAESVDDTLHVGPKKEKK